MRAQIFSLNQQTKAQQTLLKVQNSVDKKVTDISSMWSKATDNDADAAAIIVDMAEVRRDLYSGQLSDIAQDKANADIDSMRKDLQKIATEVKKRKQDETIKQKEAGRRGKFSTDLKDLMPADVLTRVEQAERDGTDIDIRSMRRGLLPFGRPGATLLTGKGRDVVVDRQGARALGFNPEQWNAAFPEDRADTPTVKSETQRAVKNRKVTKTKKVNVIRISDNAVGSIDKAEYEANKDLYRLVD